MSEKSVKKSITFSNDLSKVPLAEERDLLITVPSLPTKKLPFSSSIPPYTINPIAAQPVDPNTTPIDDIGTFIEGGIRRVKSENINRNVHFDGTRNESKREGSADPRSVISITTDVLLCQLYPVCDLKPHLQVGHFLL